MEPGAQVLTVVDASGQAGASTLAEYWHYRTLFLFLTLRDIRLRYRRTWRGVVWALLQPVLPMLILAAVFARALRPELPAGPYWLFVLAGIAPWNFFANAVNYAGATFVDNAGLLNKVYFPRAILPVATVSACLADLLVSTTVLIGLSWWQGYAPTARLLLLPLVMLAEYAIAAAFGLAAASFTALHRDLKALVPFVVQVCMYAGPVFYPLGMIPQRWRWAAWVNPMTAVLEGFRGCLLGSAMNGRGVAISAGVFCVAALGAALLYRKVEQDLAENV